MAMTFASCSLGCRVNQAEKERFDRELISLGFLYKEDRPFFYIINSCSVTLKAERETRQTIYQIKKRFPKTKIVLTGCAATRWVADGIEIGEIDYVIDNFNKDFLASIIHNQQSNNNYPFQKISISKKINSKYLSSKRLLIKIQDGCRHYCSFCIVPRLRGYPKSKSIKEIISEIIKSERDIREVILTAVNTEEYGFDTGERFTDLLYEILEKTKIPRLSLGSVNPGSIDNNFLKFTKYAIQSKRFVRFFHIPLQSGSNKILKLMNRDYTKKEFSDKIKYIIKIDPLAFIGTDIITGFIGEEDEDFLKTYKYLKSLPISKFHIFRFSKREKTIAFHLARKYKEPSMQIKEKRAEILSNLGKMKYNIFLKKMIDIPLPALFLKKREGKLQMALLDNQVPIMIETENNLCGKILNVKAIKAKDDKLLGKLL